MKRIVSLAAIVLTLTMALSLAACGEEPGTNENTENGQNQTSSNETGKTVDLAALRTQFVTDYSLTDVLEVETEGLNNLYGITEDMVKNSASFSASSADEVVIRRTPSDAWAMRPAAFSLGARPKDTWSALVTAVVSSWTMPAAFKSAASPLMGVRTNRFIPSFTRIRFSPVRETTSAMVPRAASSTVPS